MYVRSRPGVRKGIESRVGAGKGTSFVGTNIYRTTMKSLILAQDER